jgi:hypothetical protein
MEEKKTFLEKLKDAITLKIDETVEVELKEETKEEPKVEVKLAQMVLEDGETTIEAEEFAPDMGVFIVNGEDRVALPVGNYILSDGMELVVEEEGVIKEIREAVVEEPVAEEAEADFVTREEFNAAMDELRAELSATPKEELAKVEEEKVELEKTNEELQKVIDETPDAPLKKVAPVKLEKTIKRAGTMRGRVIQGLQNLN